MCCTVVICVVLLLFVLFYVLFVCKCVLYHCHRVFTQLQLTNIAIPLLPLWAVRPVQSLSACTRVYILRLCIYFLDVLRNWDISFPHLKSFNSWSTHVLQYNLTYTEWHMFIKFNTTVSAFKRVLSNNLRISRLDKPSRISGPLYWTNRMQLRHVSNIKWSSSRRNTFINTCCMITRVKVLCKTHVRKLNILYTRESQMKTLKFK